MNVALRLILFLIRAWWLAIVFGTFPAAAQEPQDPAGQPTVEVSSDTLERKIKEAEDSSSLDAATKTKLLELYRKALGYQQKAQDDLAAAEAFEKARETAPKQAEEARQRLASARETSPIASLDVNEATPLAEVDSLLLKEKADLAAVEAKLADLERALAAEAERPAAARKRLTEARQRQEKLTADLNAPPPPGEPAAVTQARRWLLQSQNQALSAEIRKLDQELLSQPMRLELLQAQRDRNAGSVTWIGERVRHLEGLVSDRRLAEAEQARTKAEEDKLEAQGKHPLVRELAQRNADLSQEISALALAFEQVAAEDDKADKQARQVSDQFRSTRQKLEVAGMNQVLGQILLEQRRRLPVLAGFQKQADAREEAIAEAGLRQLQLEEERSQLKDVEEYVDLLLDDRKVEEAGPIRGELWALAESRRGLLDQAMALNQAYVRALGELDFAQTQLMDTVKSYRAFIDENLLWIRSASAPNLVMLRDLPSQLGMLLDPAAWMDVGRILREQTTTSPLLVLAIALAALLLWRGPRLRALLRATGKALVKPSEDSFIYTFKALIYTLLLALPWPLLIFATGWELGGAASRASFAAAVARGAVWVGEAFFYLQFFYVLCIGGGVAAVHFRWPQEMLKRLRQALRQLMALLLPAAFVTMIAISYESATMGGGLGRIGFVVVVASLSVFFYQLFRLKRGALQAYLERHPGSLLARFRRLWLALTIALPLALAVLGLWGYVYTAGTLTGRFIDSMWLVLILVVVHQLVARWLTVARRRLALQAAMERRAAARATAVEKAAVPGTEDLHEAVEQKPTDLEALSQDTRQLMNTVLVILGIAGIWLIWSPVLPAFGLLDKVTLWHYTGLSEGEEKILPVTLADVGLALLILAITVVATKRFPAMLEIALLQRLKMTSGGRYAATSLSSYVIVAVGALLAFNTVGASWGQFQWLVAALGVGIGFGLQEIVANFISGLIILFERPIRVGDIVTVGDTDGVVTRIQIRATTIRNWDRKELLVPNKEFITGRLLNWSLSDQTTRIFITVGLVYGGDVQKAMALMAEAAEEHQRILSDPPPFVAFEGFGDNALILNLRCYTNELDFRLATTSELHEIINQKFNDAGLVIAFPQRDVHLDTTRPLEIVLRRQGGATPESGP
jgi:potassium efflux system protein